MRWRQLFEGIDEPAYVVRDDGSADVSRETIEKLDRVAGMPIGALVPVVAEAMAKTDDEGDLWVLGVNGRTLFKRTGEDEWRELRNPAPGLEQVNAAGVPSWAEMRATYPPYTFDREKARAAVAASKLADVPQPPMEQLVEHAKAAAEAHYATQAGEVDFRHMLKDDDAAWSARNRLAKVLRREYLATAIVDQLDPETAAKLADRLDTLVSEAVAETELRISGEVSQAVSAYSEQLAVDREARRKQAEEAKHERFNRPSRLS